MKRLALVGLLAALLPARWAAGEPVEPGEAAVAYAVLGVPDEATAAAASRLADQVRAALDDAGLQRDRGPRLRELVAQAGGIQRCDVDCRGRIARALHGVRLLEVVVSQGGGWTAVRLQMRTPEETRFLGSVLAAEDSLAGALRQATWNAAGVPGRLRLVGGPDGKVVHVAGRTHGVLPLTEPIELDPGVHVVRLGDGRRAWRMVEATVAARQTTRLHLGRLPRPPQVSTGPRPLWKRPWVWGVVGGLVAGGAYVGVRELSEAGNSPSRTLGVSWDP